MSRKFVILNTSMAQDICKMVNTDKDNFFTTYLTQIQNWPLLQFTLFESIK
jgi:hypothetical protein